MKIVVTLEIEIQDPAEWTTAHGVTGAAQIRQDVKDYSLNLVQQAAVWDEVTATVSLR